MHKYDHRAFIRVFVEIIRKSHCLISFISRHPECLPGYKSAAWVAVVGKGNLPDKRDYLIPYTRLVFLVAVKTVREDFLFIPDSFGNHWNIPEHDDE